ncbi:hypothetical protein SAMN02800687_0467 [Curtobacterium sp. UNCCL20]|uniref:copper resistance CopC family protein n=1 Tax=Curtobacterium sp. UNCCL20 TaxID=1502773 RepID=UPI00088B7DE5|nr:copper resistance CopC family protein [Curtobacterium sp. UNCCL20]SDQ12956.1 hypothetical protein SAMN02800687_0467 [Curtobacterium sp. UNCCL20]
MSLRALLAAALPAALLVVVLGAATPAAAHDVLSSAVPAADSSVSGDLDEVALTFTEPPLAGLESGIVVSVLGPDGSEVSSGRVRVDGSTLRKSVDLTERGDYTLAWRSVSVDGHPISGGHRFTSAGLVVATTAPTTPARSTPSQSTESPASPAPSTTTDASPSPAAAAAPSGTGAAPWVLGGIAALAAAALVVTLLLTRRRAGSPD